MSRQRLTCGFIKAVNRPGRYGDGGRGSFGLSLLVKPARSGGLIKNWQQRYRKDGKYTSRGLGVYPDVSLEQARALAVHFVMKDRPVTSALATMGRRTNRWQNAWRRPDMRFRRPVARYHQCQPQVVAVNLENHPTSFRRMFAEALEFRSRGFKPGSKTAAQAKSLFEAYVPRELGDRPIAEVAPANLIACLQSVWHSSPSTAQKLLQHLGGTFRHSLANDLIEVDPLVKAKLGLGKLKQRVQNFRALSHFEVGAALAKVRSSDAYPSAKLCLTFLTLTATRSGEARLAEWSEIDLDTRTWTIPAERMKAGRQHRVPLSQQALDVLQEARSLDDGSRLIFPSVGGRPLGDGTISKLLRDRGIEGTPHGMRSSFRNWCAETGVPRELAESALAHVVQNATEAAYLRSDLLERRSPLMQEWANHVDPAGAPPF